MNILAIDVSGNFKEGKGTSGFCFLENGEPQELFELKATSYRSAEHYWYDHTATIMKYYEKGLDAVVIEGYRLYNHRGMSATSQANSELETVQLIGVLKHFCWEKDIHLAVQYASEVKSRWKESVLVALGHLGYRNNRYFFKGEVTNDHKRDALKHALHYERYGKHE